MGGARRGVRWGGVLGLGVGLGVGVGAGLEDARRGIRWGGVLRGVLGAGVLGVVLYQVGIRRSIRWGIR